MKQGWIPTSRGAPPATADPFGRTIDYLRISITQRCNERCLYCLPEGRKTWESSPDWMTNGEILRVVRAATRLGFRKFRLTGGEPLIRPDLPALIGEMAQLDGVECICLSTNGTRLAGLAAPMRAAGLRTVNVSLDALDPALYRRITGGRVESVLEGIRAALQAGYESIKLNCVLLRGLNENEIWPLILFAGEHRLPLRLIELMPVSRIQVLSERNFLSISEIIERLGQRDELVPQPETRLGFGPARYYRLTKTGALVGFIGAMTHPHFCATCNRLRLTADGKIRPCLGRHGEVDLLSVLRSGRDEEGRLVARLEEAIAAKPQDHEFRNNFQPCRPMTAIGG